MLVCVRCKTIDDSNCKIEALFGAKDVIVVEMVFFHGLYNIDAFLAGENAYLVACIDYHEYQEQQAAKGTNVGRQRIFALIQVYLVRLAELVRFL